MANPEFTGELDCFKCDGKGNCVECLGGPVEATPTNLVVVDGRTGKVRNTSNGSADSFPIKLDA